MLSNLNKNKEYIKINSNKITELTFVKDYLDKCKYYGVGIPFSNDFKSEFNIIEHISIQDAKKLALNKFIDFCVENNTTDNITHVGFSDDDKKTISLIKEFFEHKSANNQSLHLYVHDTSDKNIKGGIKTKYTNNILQNC